MMNLLNETSLVFHRQSTGDVLTEEGYYQRTPVREISVIGSLQPFALGKNNSKLPEGVTTSDARVFYTETPLDTYNTVAKTSADYTTISGRDYEVFNVGDWSLSSLSPTHYKVILIMKGLVTGRQD